MSRKTNPLAGRALNDEQEATVVNWIKEQYETNNQPVTNSQIQDYVKELVIREQITFTRFVNDRPGGKWLLRFFERHPEVLSKSARPIPATNTSRSSSVSEKRPESSVSDPYGSEEGGDSEGRLIISEDSDMDATYKKIGNAPELKVVESALKSIQKSSQKKKAITAESERCPQLDEAAVKLMFFEGEDDFMFKGFSAEDTSLKSNIDLVKIYKNKAKLDQINIADIPIDWWQSLEELEEPDAMTVMEEIDFEMEDGDMNVVSLLSSWKRESCRRASANPAYRKPFQYGFKRELVYRKTPDGVINPCRNADVYYYAPDGRKLRSNREVLDYLYENPDIKKHLSLLEFTFLKEPTLAAPEFERVRGANEESIVASTKTTRKMPTKVVPAKKFKEAESSPKPTTAAPEATTSSQPSRLQRLQRAVPPKPTNLGTKGVTKSKSPSAATANRSLSDGSMTKCQFKQQNIPPCSIHCSIAGGLMPSLQCTTCFCNYHPVCVGITKPLKTDIRGYMCPNCRQGKKEKVAGSAIASGSQPSDGAANQPQQLEEVAGPSMVTLAVPPTFNMAMHMSTGVGDGNKVLLWRPPQGVPVMPIQAPTFAPQRPPSEQPPQTLAIMNGKKYIVMPRSNTNSTQEMGTTPESTRAPLVSQPPQVHMLSGGTSKILPRGTLLSGGPGPGGLFRMSEAHEAVLHQPPFMVVNAIPQVAATATLGMMAATPNALGGQPKPALGVDGEAQQPRLAQLAKPIKGLYSFTERLEAHQRALLSVLRLLSVQDLLRASRTCRTWRAVADDRGLWNEVHMCGSSVSNWRKCIAALVRHGTVHLDLRNLAMPKREEEAQAMWQEFCAALADMPPASNLRRLDLCRCPASVVAALAAACRQLQVIWAPSITKGDQLDLTSISNLEELRGLRLKSLKGLNIENFHLLANTANISQLSLTSVRMLDARQVAAALGAMVGLELLELGDCTGLLTHPQTVADTLAKLTKLKRLRLEKLVPDVGSEAGGVRKLLSALRSLPLLDHLELINIEAEPECEKALAKLTTLKHLLLIPSYVKHGGRTCQLLLRGILHLRELKQLMWVVTTEVLSVTKKLIRNKAPSEAVLKSLEEEEVIPVLPPLPAGLPEVEASAGRSELCSLTRTEPLEIVSLSSLKDFLEHNLSNTKVTISKVSFNVTWRHTLSEWHLVA